MVPQLLKQYINGNYAISLYMDGTKVRTTIGLEETPMPEYPESVDMKITDYCDAGCGYCHENSTTKGRHAKFEDIKTLVEGLPEGVELAIGGGNPLAHPEINTICKYMCGKGLIPNITVNHQHIANMPSDLNYWGLGVSYNPKYSISMIPSKAVVHLILGVHSI